MKSYSNNAHAVVSERGQVVIPKAVRDQLGIQPGQHLVFLVKKGKIVLFKKPTDDPVEKVYGVIKTQQSTDELLRQIRGSG